MILNLNVREISHWLAPLPRKYLVAETSVFAAADVILAFLRPTSLNQIALLFVMQAWVFSQVVLLAIWLLYGKSGTVLKIVSIATALVLMVVLLPTRLVERPVQNWSPFDCLVHIEYSPATAAFLGMPIILLAVRAFARGRHGRLSRHRHHYSLAEILYMQSCVAVICFAGFAAPFYDANLVVALRRVITIAPRDSFAILLLGLPAIGYSAVGQTAIWTFRSRYRGMLRFVWMGGPFIVSTAHVLLFARFHGIRASSLGVRYTCLVALSYIVAYLVIYITFHRASSKLASWSDDSDRMRDEHYVMR
jgi:hypothetical protein